MSSLLRDILTEWEGGCFYNDALLSEAYTHALQALLEATPGDRADHRVVPFLLVGYLAYMREQEGADPQALLTFRMALAMAGQGSVEPSAQKPSEHARVPEPSAQRRRSPSPQPGPSNRPEPPVQRRRSPSPQPGPSSRPDPQPVAKRPRSPSPQPGPSSRPDPQPVAKRPRSPSPQPGPSKRPLDDEATQPTIEVLQSRERELKRFKTKFREEVVMIKGLGDTLPSEDLMVSLFDTILQRQKEAVKGKNSDRVIFEMESVENADNPLWFSMRRVDQLNGRVILDKLERVLNSNQAFMANGQLKLSYIHVPTPHDGGRRINRVPNETMDQWLERMTGRSTIFSPDNARDSMCLARSIVIAKSQEGMKYSTFSRLKKPESGVQEKLAKELCDKAHIGYDQACGLDEIQLMQDALPDHRLCVFTDKHGKECIFKGPYSRGRKNVYLLLHKEHFSAILYPCQAFEVEATCDKCVVFFKCKRDHRCEGSCWRCFGDTAHDSPDVPLVRCPDCRHQFSGDECLQRHKTVKLHNSTLTKCEAFRFCPKCEKSYNSLKSGKHVCFFVYCKNCKENVKENHLCYMSNWTEPEKKKKWKYITIYYDVETTQCDPVEGKQDTFEHKPNLLVSQAVCDECIGVVGNEHFCTVCQTRQHKFHNLDDPETHVMGQFLDYLQSFGTKTEILLVAHNAKAFDAIFVLQELVARNLSPALTLQGAKILCMQVGNWKFIDSLMFLPMPLSAMPKSFGLDELKKGYWPFLANKPDYYKYEGPMLDREFYCMSNMKSKAVDDFNHWYDTQVSSNFVFNFRRELIDYCISDVTILRQSCQAFRKLFQEVAGFDPMFHCITLSSACMRAFRRNFLTANKIGLVPPGGYHGRGKQSHIALQWLDYEAHKLGKVIKTIYTDREVDVMGRLVDGYVEVPIPGGTVERRIYQFHGCYWHECPDHFPATSDSGESKYERTVRLTAMFRRNGYTVIEKWECEFKRELQSDPEVKDYFANHPTSRTPPLNLRDGLAGGRTSALKWYYKADLTKGEKVKLVDVISEYPNANLRGKYPVGHPEIHVEGSTTLPLLENWNGMILCTVLPPRDLYLPVLPYKCNGKLLFPLCRTCAESESTEICRHTPAQRQLIGSWCAPELHLALKKDYQLVGVHELYQYPGTSQYNPQTKEDGLLSAYVRCFMALKIQASGWPPECTTEELKAKFVEDTLEHDGVVVDPTKMAKNPALRTLSKLMCNSFWGKFGEKTLRPKTELIYKPEQLMVLITDPRKTVTALLPLSEECLQVTWKPVEDSEVSLPSSSLIHAAFTTCHGRLQLYKYLDVVKERALYHDTDSVAYISRPGEPELTLGSHLGDLTDQIEEDHGPGSYITEFAAGGPKNYAFKVAVGGDLKNIKVCIKVRGISINSSCDKLVTFENLKAMVMGSRDKVTVPIPRQIARLPTWKVVTRPTTKKWQAKNTKRRRVGMENTVPHGFNAWDMADEDEQETLEVMDFLGDD